MTFQKIKVQYDSIYNIDIELAKHFDKNQYGYSKNK